MNLTGIRRMFFLLLVVALGSLLALSAACSGDDDDDDGGDDGGSTATEPADGDDDDDGGGDGETIDMAMTDNAFEPKEITVSAGATLTINLTNDGAAIHNLRIAGEDNEYDNADDAVSDPDIVSAGETATAEWVAPDDAGTIDFRCDFHPTDMVGTITVE
jgi:plastocyanin